VEPGTSGLAEIMAAFGDRVLQPDGSLDRERLGEIVFSDDAARATLNAIVHPRVGDRMRELEQAAGDAAIVVHDIPLLAENGLATGFDAVVVVDAPPQAQTERLVNRGLSASQAAARMAAQASREQRLAIATFVVDNSGSLADLDREVEHLWASLLAHTATR
jgi:dephospho-CoA kinase